MTIMGAPQADEQAKLDAMLARGIVFSIVWLAGFGSIIALRAGLRARGAIRANPSLEGMGRAWWCIVAGGMGVAALSAVVVIGGLNVLLDR